MAFAVSTIVAGIGVGIAGFGAYENYEGTKAAAGANAAAARTQAQIAGLQASNVDTEEAQLHLQTQQSDLQIETNRSVVQQQQAAADIQQQAASLDVTRRIRQAIRNGIVASGTSLNTAADSGATQPGSTAVRQVRANIQGETNNNILGLNQNFSVGTQEYNIQKGITQTYLDAQDKNEAFVNQSEVLQHQALETQRQIYALGGQSSNDYAEAAIAQGNAAMGQGMFALGGGIASASNGIGKLTNYFSGPGGAYNLVTQGTNGWFQ